MLHRSFLFHIHQFREFLYIEQNSSTMLTFEKRISIKAWAENDRPREKLVKNGRHQLSEAELLAIILGSGNEQESAVELARRILGSCGNMLDQLSKLSVTELCHFHGIGPEIGRASCRERVCQYV